MENKNKTELTAADLALYLGCECQTPNGKGIIEAVNTDRARVEIDGTGLILHPMDVYPTLRPLSDMTEEEYMEVQYRVDKIGIGYDAQQGAEITRYLLSNRFDLFGWIPAGLAIDKTKI